MAKILIEVPDGPYCWRKGTFEHICQYFDNPTGYPDCKLGFDNTTEIPEGPLRPVACIEKELK